MRPRETDTGITVQSRHYISSLAGSAEQLLRAAWAHWSIEYSLHWSPGRHISGRPEPDALEPQSSEYGHAKADGPYLLKRETSLKVGIQGKRLQAGWREDYLLKVLPS